MSQRRDVESTVMTPRKTRRAVAAATAGAIIEGYDLIIFGVYAALVFPQLFFPATDPATGVLLGFTSYFIGFVARPLGGLIFGHLGDRKGRKPVMIMTLSLVAIGTAGPGILPGYAEIGVTAPILLVLCRLIQGVGFGGEWGGGTLLSMESGRAARAAFLASFPQSGAMWGLALSNLTVLLMQQSMEPEAFLAWGWRLPLITSIVLFGVGMYLRTKVEETPVFQQTQENQAIARVPLFQVFRTQPKILLATTLMRAGSSIPVFIFSAFILSYGPARGLSPASVLISVIAAGALAGVATPIAGMSADRFGRLLVWRIGAVLTTALSVALFVCLDNGASSTALVLITFSLVPFSMMFGPEAALLSRSFAPAWRYSGSSFAYNIGGIIGGGLAPVLAQLLVQSGHANALSWYVGASCLIGIGASVMLNHSSSSSIPKLSDSSMTESQTEPETSTS